MGIRIDIDWDFVSPALQAASGVVSIVAGDGIGGSPTGVILQCRCHIEKGSNGFSELSEGEGVSNDLFEIFRDQIKSMMHSFFKGMLLEKSDYHWIEDSLRDEIHYTQWLKSKGYNGKLQFIEKPFKKLYGI